MPAKLAGTLASAGPAFIGGVTMAEFLSLHGRRNAIVVY